MFAATPILTMAGKSAVLSLDPAHLSMTAGKLRADLLLNPDAKSVGLDLEARPAARRDGKVTPISAVTEDDRPPRTGQGRS